MGRRGLPDPRLCPRRGASDDRQVLSAAAGPDAARVRELLDKMIATTESFSVSYRLRVGTTSSERSSWWKKARSVTRDKVTVIEGYFVDLTADRR